MTPMFALDGLMTIVIMVVVFMLFMSLLQRPLKKQQQQAQQMRDGLTEGDRVVLTSGMFVTITHVGSEQAIVELAPGVEVTIRKQSIVALVKPDEEEFVFADEVDEDEVTDEVDSGEAPVPTEDVPVTEETGSTVPTDTTPEPDKARPGTL